MRKVMKKKMRVILIVPSVILVLLLIARFCGRKGVLNGIEFSDAYSDRNGRLMKIFLTDDEKYRLFVPLGNFSEEFITAILEQEDKRFFLHGGVNFASLFRAFTETYIKKSRVIGGSTITMQTAKLVYKINTRNVFGKIRQIFCALWLDWRYEKNEILEAYLNLAPCGKNIEGFGAAAVFFFGKSVADLSLDECIMLAVLPQNPTRRFPSKDYIPEELGDAMERLSERMGMPKYIVPDLKFSFPDEANHFMRFLHLTQGVEKNLHEVKRTSIDFSMQRILESAVSGISEKNAAALLLNSKSMEIEAYVGSKDFWNVEISGQVDGNISKRSPGSCLKPFIYALALDQGIIHSNTLLADTPASFGNYLPDNYGSTFKGPILARDALIQSQNVPAVFLESQINPDLYDFMKFSDVENLMSKKFYGYSIALGAAEVSPLEVAKMYAMILNGGVKKEINYFCKNVLDDTKTERFFTEEAACIIKKILEENVPPEERSFMPNKIKVGFKTGTSYRFRDAWTAGFFGDYVLCVWVGNFNGKDGNFIGRENALPLFFAIADEIIQTKKLSDKNSDEKMPLGVSVTKVCALSGGLPTKNCGCLCDAYFIPGVSPINKCSVHREISEGGKTYVAEFWRSDFLELFEKAGLPRANAKIDMQFKSSPPKILSPIPETEYYVGDKDRDSLILQASADYGISDLFWFLDSRLIARTKPNEKYEWKAEPGKHLLTVLDPNGMGCTQSLVVF